MRKALLLAAITFTSQAMAGPVTRFRCTGADGAVTYSETVCPASATCLAFAGNKWSADACEEARNPRPAGFLGDYRDPCRHDLKCWWAKVRTDAEIACSVAVSARAKYDYRWESRWTEPKFNLLSWTDLPAGRINIGGRNISMQNAFGVWQRMMYVCSYDSINDTVYDLAVAPAQ